MLIVLLLDMVCVCKFFAGCFSRLIGVMGEILGEGVDCLWRVKEFQQGFRMKRSMFWLHLRLFLYFMRDEWQFSILFPKEGEGGILLIIDDGEGHCKVFVVVESENKADNCCVEVRRRVSVSMYTIHLRCLSVSQP